MARTIEFSGQQLFRHRHAHRVGNALTERSGGRLDARRIAIFRMPGGFRMQLPELLDVLDRQVVTGQMQQRVKQHRAVAVGEHEAVAIGPLRVGRIVLQVVIPEHLGDLGHAHRRARVARFGLFDRVHRQRANRAGEVVEDRGFEIGECGRHFFLPGKRVIMRDSPRSWRRCARIRSPSRGACSPSDAGSSA